VQKVQLACTSPTCARGESGRDLHLLHPLHLPAPHGAGQTWNPGWHPHPSLVADSSSTPDTRQAERALVRFPKPGSDRPGREGSRP